MAAVVRAFVGYFFLVFIVRFSGRRPGKQITPFEYVLVFFIGGLALTAIVGDDPSLTNAISVILGIALAHYVITWARSRWPRVALIVDGTPLVLFDEQEWRSLVLARMRVFDDDVMATARDQGFKTFDDVDRAILERNGEISIAARDK